MSFLMSVFFAFEQAHASRPFLFFFSTLKNKKEVQSIKDGFLKTDFLKKLVPSLSQENDYYFNIPGHNLNIKKEDWPGIDNQTDLRFWGSLSPIIVHKLQDAGIETIKGQVEEDGTITFCSKDSVQKNTNGVLLKLKQGDFKEDEDDLLMGSARYNFKVKFTPRCEEDETENQEPWEQINMPRFVPGLAMMAAFTILVDSYIESRYDNDYVKN